MIFGAIQGKWEFAMELYHWLIDNGGDLEGGQGGGSDRHDEEAVVRVKSE